MLKNVKGRRDVGLKPVELPGLLGAMKQESLVFRRERFNKMYPRYLKTKLLEAFKTSPIVLLLGPRQSGKTTLMREIGKELSMEYVTLDTLSKLAIAQDDPEGFIHGLPRPVIIDEVQRAPQIALPIKVLVDQDRTAGSFGLTGSANPLVAPKLNDSLAGRMFILHMWPLSVSEINGRPSSFLETIFEDDPHFPSKERVSPDELIERFSKGGYPQALSLSEQMSDAWYEHLLTTIIERDVQDLKNISKPSELAKLLRILANRHSNLMNVSEISRTAAIPYTTLHQYLHLLEALFLIIRQPAWHQNKTKRLVKMPKLYFGDTGLLMNQLRVNRKALLEDRNLFGHILENFVFLELKKLATWSIFPIEFFHYRTQTGIEVDLLLENRAGEIVAIEVKPSETLTSEDWKGLKSLKAEKKENMVRGVILYLGKETISLGPNLIALPLSTLW